MTAKKGKSLDEFRNTHDKKVLVPKKIRAALAELGDSWEYEAEFVKRTGLSSTDFARYREDFSEFYVTVSAGTTTSGNSRRAWAGTKAFAEKLRESIS